MVCLKARINLQSEQYQGLKFKRTQSVAGRFLVIGFSVVCTPLRPIEPSLCPAHSKSVKRCTAIGLIPAHHVSRGQRFLVSLTSYCQHLKATIG